jgi:tRNA(adenine34) deaminase
MTTGADHAHYMALALEQARQAAILDEVPVGAIVVHQDQVIAAAHNRRELDQDPTAHAEMLALRQAAVALGSWRLCDCTVYVTLEPCPMCAGALVHARVARLVYGCDDPKAGAVRTLYTLCEDPRLNHRLEVVGGVLADACASELREFFATLRGRSG